MDILVLVIRILFLVLASLISIIYVLFQFFQKLPQRHFQLSTVDTIALMGAALMFGFGANSYYGLLAFLPLLLVKLSCRFLLQSQKLKGSGKWMEVDWRKLTPRGFDRNVPKAVLAEMNKMPRDNHFIVPRFYLLIFIKFMTKRMGKEMGKGGRDRNFTKSTTTGPRTI